MNRKNIILALSIITLHIHAMDIPMDVKKKELSQQRICYLAMLDRPVLNLIAQYLIFPDMESEEEFIERTQIKITKTPKPYDKHLPQNEWGSGSNGTLIGYCPNNTKVALLRLLCGTGATPALTIIDEKNDQALHNKPLDHKDYKYIALSRCAHMFATIHSEKYYDEETICYKHKIIIRSIILANIQEFDLFDNFGPSLIAFNKQGTHLILHGTDLTKKLSWFDCLQRGIQKDPMPHHLIFPVTVNMNIPKNGVITEDEIKARNILASQKTLQHYFHQKGVCKSIIQ